MYKILITTSGKGSRLKELTKNTNKSLIQVNGKKVIDYVIQSYNPSLELVVTIGYYGKKVKKYLQDTYPARKITFVTVDPFDGPGSSSAYSLLQAKPYLRCPFILHCNDTIVKRGIPSPERYNWNGGSTGNDPAVFNTESYSSFTTVKGYMKTINPKGALHFDYFHIGLAGIKDYNAFWINLERAYQRNPNDGTLNDVSSIKQMLKKGYKFKIIKFPEWYDTGNPVCLQNAVSTLKRI